MCLLSATPVTSSDKDCNKDIDAFLNCNNPRVLEYLAKLTPKDIGKVLTGVRLTDAHNGLRVMTAGAARRIELRQDQMAHASELVAQIGRLGLRFKEVPVTIIYSPYSVQKGQRLSNGFRILTDLLAGWLQR